MFSQLFKKTPKFWQKRGFIAFILLPFSLFYLIGFWLVNFFRKTQASSITTICIGNLNAGGSGKTPVAIAIGKILQELTMDFVYLSKGYRAKIRDFALVANEQLSLDEDLGLKYGDEPLLLAGIAPSFIGQNRAQAIKKISNLYAQKNLQAIIIDDGLQNNSFKKDLKILVVDGNIGFGNGFLIPAGPLRQRIWPGINSADIIILIDDQEGALKARIKDLFNVNQKQSTPLIIDANLVASNLNTISSRNVIAFCGIAYPQKFFSFLTKEKFTIIETRSFYDHKIYEDSELKELQDLADKHQAKLITTKKDWVKFPKLWQEKISFLDVEIKFQNQENLINKIKNTINAK